MRRQVRSVSVAAMVAMLAVLLTWGSASAAQSLLVTITDSPDPALSLGNVTYVIKVKNDWTQKATDVAATIPLPPGTQFVSCKTAPTVRPCAPAGGTVTVNIGNIVAKAVFKITLVLQMPSVSADTTVTLSASATGSNVSSGAGQQATLVQAGGIDRGALVVTISDTPDPAPMLGQVTYAVSIKNDSTVRATNTVVTIDLPSGAGFVKCATTPKKICTETAGTVTATFGSVLAHATVKISLVATTPSVSAPTPILLTVHANADGVSDDTDSETTTVLPNRAPVVFGPSGRQTTVGCGETLNFGGDTTVQFLGGLGCASLPNGSSNAALTVQTAGTTVNLAGFKIVGGALASNLGNIGIRVFNAPNVTVAGGGTNGTSGLEYFDIGVKEEGSGGLVVDSLRVFRGRTAGIQTVSDGVTLSNLLIDRSVAVTGATGTLPGGVGIHASGNTLINNTMVRRSRTIGIWADGTHQDGSGFVTTITGNTTTSQITDSAGISLQLDNGPHNVKDTLIAGDGVSGTSTHAVVVGTSVGTNLDGVAVKDHGGDGFVINGTSTRISRSSVESSVGGNGFVIAGPGADLNGNDAQSASNGFVINGSAAVLTSNSAAAGQDGFVVNGDSASLSSNNAVGNAGRGIVVQGVGGTYASNTAQLNGTPSMTGHGMVISGNNNHFVSNVSKQNRNAGYFITGTGNDFSTNSAELNTGTEWIIGPNNVDDGGNKLNGSAFSFTAAGGSFN
ncbi:MAG: hypothetical protein C5B48_00650 [Candidatus Rokuibacteriota bacterium]|nr:MAG: hypothetical protein C5B48_00650 [Candidatus Rokubacteria bacterium]